MGEKVYQNISFFPIFFFLHEQTKQLKYENEHQQHLEVMFIFNRCCFLHIYKIFSKKFYTHTRECVYLEVVMEFFFKEFSYFWYILNQFWS